MCMDISATGMHRGHGAYPGCDVRGSTTPTGGYHLGGPATHSPIKSECGGLSGVGGVGGGVQSLHNKPFRWMTIKRNPAKPGKDQSCSYIILYIQ
jgi:hypothetical protein